MANEQNKPACMTCGGSGWVGGPSYYAPDEGGEECPDCALPPVAGEAVAGAIDARGQKPRGKRSLAGFMYRHAVDIASKQKHANGWVRGPWQLTFDIEGAKRHPHSGTWPGFEFFPLYRDLSDEVRTDTALTSPEQSPASPDAGAVAVAEATPWLGSWEVPEGYQSQRKYDLSLMRGVDAPSFLGGWAAGFSCLYNATTAAPASAPEAPEQQREYPPLPTPLRRNGQQMSYDGNDKSFFDCYCADQMRAYVDADRAALAQAAPATGKVAEQDQGEA